MFIALLALARGRGMLGGVSQDGPVLPGAGGQIIGVWQAVPLRVPVENCQSSRRGLRLVASDRGVNFVNF